MKTKKMIFLAVALLVVAMASCSKDPDVPTGKAFYGTYVDLGLPSGTLWATCNVGADTPEGYGDYFAWGETTTKSTYSWDTYKYYNGSVTKYTGNDGLTTLQSGDDAATANWGSGWCMPTKAQWEELQDNTNVTWTTQNGVNGRKFTASNGNSLFLPAAGLYGEVDAAGGYGFYWSSSLYTDYPSRAWYFSFHSDGYIMDYRGYRYDGLSVRPVRSGLGGGSGGGNVDSQTFTVNGVSFKMVFVEGGTFQMGATSEQGDDAYADENPVHSVTLSGYYMGETEVTQELWQAVMGSNPSSFSGTNLPVESVSWNDIVNDFLPKLNQATGQNFRLPTEAEWEFAARGGKNSKSYKYAGSSTIENVAWYIDNSSNMSHAVKTKTANELGLYDMSGNVWEWCSDWYGDYSSGSQTNPTGPSSGSYRVLRGGSWSYNARICRVSYRSNYDPDYGNGNRGFRLVLPQ
ncbi:MAG: SUMF1/EgtB/PvdO family nonheme iron enzyme [Bacteroidales bacterium]|nr:SUMF1/EgtB/PvdO family nonheme iron enzyme [Bacteroidales bacterium]